MLKQKISEIEFSLLKNTDQQEVKRILDFLKQFEKNENIESIGIQKHLKFCWNWNSTKNLYS
ncbi:MAG TPA: hypothetical protein EYP22_09335 [Methanosarcinales archaeon]|nr:hypothetical protein [Methanosarcinales archaeon]